MHASMRVRTPDTVTARSDALCSSARVSAPNASAPGLLRSPRNKTQAAVEYSRGHTSPKATLSRTEGPGFPGAYDLRSVACTPPSVGLLNGLRITGWLLR